jgi:UDP-2,3-diacylglucosamine pyrophosphatase LpxH
MIVFMSDLHISSPLFKSDDAVISIYNDSSVDEVYILGDFFDTWEQNPFLTARKKSHLVSTINNSQKTRVLLKGNHDPSIKTMSEIFDNVIIRYKFEIDLFGKRTLLIHGDEFDESKEAGRAWFPVHYVLQRVGLNIKAFLRNSYHKFVMFKERKDYNSLILKTEKMIVDYYGNDYDIIITGHTHLPKVIKLDNCYYANCGSMVYKPTYIVADKSSLFISEV